MPTFQLLTLLTLAALPQERTPAPYRVMEDVRRPAPLQVAAPAAEPDGRPLLRPSAASGPVTTTAERVGAQLATSFEAPEATRVHFDVAADGTHHVLGVDYKARFGADGATFVPFFGSRAPRNFPVHFAVERVAHGASELRLEAPSIRHQGDRVRLDQGLVRSEYVALPRGLEQLFVFDAPVGEGDLVLELGVESELALHPDGAGWRFVGEHGAVAYGAAFVLDAAGVRRDLDVTSDGERLRFTVPADFLHGAVWPIAIDPLITTLSVDLDAKDQLEVDVAYDPTRDLFLVVFEEVFSLGDSDIKTWSVDTNGVVVPGSDRYIDFTFVNRVRPRVALSNAIREFLVVYVEGAAGSGRRIGARPRNADSDAIGTEFIVDEATATDRFEADICGDTFAGSSATVHYTVVWRRYWSLNDSDVVTRVVNPNGTFVTSEVYVTNFVSVSDEQPSISKTITPSFNESIVVWRRLEPLSGNYSIHAATLNYNGSIVTPEYQIADPRAAAQPQVSGLSNATRASHPGATYIACWERDFGTDSDIEAVVVSPFAALPAVSAIENLSLMEHVDLFLDQVSPDIACLGEQWLIVYSAVYPGFSDYVTRSTTVNLVGDSFGIPERFVPLTLSFEETLTPKVASRHEGGDVGALGALTAWIQQAAFGAQGDVHGAAHEAVATLTCAAQVGACYGNPNSSTPYTRSFLWIEGDPSTTTTKRLRAVDLSRNAFGYFLVAPGGLGGFIPPGSSGLLCLTGPIGRYSGSILNSGASGAFSLSISPASISQPTGPVAAVAGQTWYFQAWHRDTTAAGAASSNFTNTVALPFQ